MELRETLDVQLVENGVVHGVSGGRSSSQSNAGSITTHFGIASASSSASAMSPSSPPGGYGKARAASQSTAALDRLRVGVDQQLRRVEAMPAQARRGRARGSRSAGRGRLRAGSRASRGRCAASARAAARGRPRRRGRARHARHARRRARSSFPHRATSHRAGKDCPARRSLALRDEPEHRERRQRELDRERLAVPRKLLGRDAARSAGAPAGVALGVRVQDLAPGAPRGEADPVAGAVRRRRSCTRRRASGCRPPDRRAKARTFAAPSPASSQRKPEGRSRAPRAPARLGRAGSGRATSRWTPAWPGSLEQVPVEAPVGAPLLLLRDLAAHEQQLLARMRPHVRVERAQVRELAPAGRRASSRAASPCRGRPRRARAAARSSP